MMLFDTLDTEEKAQHFRKYRLDWINNGEVWGPLSDGPYCVLHWLPISKEVLFSVDDLNPEEFSKFIRNLKPLGRTEEINSDGINFRSIEKDETKEGASNPLIEGDQGRYFWNAQVFHSGAMEMAIALSFRDYPPGTKRLYQGEIIEELWKAMDGFKECMSHFNITAPIIVGVSLLRVLDYRFSDNSYTRLVTGDRTPRPPSNKEEIILSGERVEKVQDIGKIERTIFDSLWRIFGIAKCEYYNENGRNRNV